MKPARPRPEPRRGQPHRRPRPGLHDQQASDVSVPAPWPPSARYGPGIMVRRQGLPAYPHPCSLRHPVRGRPSPGSSAPSPQAAGCPLRPSQQARARPPRPHSSLVPQASPAATHLTSQLDGVSGMAQKMAPSCDRSWPPAPSPPRTEHSVPKPDLQ